MTQLAMDTITAQLILDELCDRINQQKRYAVDLANQWRQEHLSREELLCESTAAAYRHSMAIVAKHTGIKINWGSK